MTLRDLSVTAVVGAVAGAVASSVLAVAGAIVLELALEAVEREEFARRVAAAARTMGGR